MHYSIVLLYLWRYLYIYVRKLDLVLFVTMVEYECNSVLSCKAHYSQLVWVDVVSYCIFIATKRCSFIFRYLYPCKNTLLYSYLHCWRLISLYIFHNGVTQVEAANFPGKCAVVITNNLLYCESSHACSGVMNCHNHNLNIAFRAIDTWIFVMVSSVCINVSLLLFISQTLTTNARTMCASSYLRNDLSTNTFNYEFINVVD